MPMHYSVRMTVTSLNDFFVIKSWSIVSTGAGTKTIFRGHVIPYEHSIHATTRTVKKEMKVNIF
jgi:hypothetical protein